MRADYESRADSLAIELEDVGHWPPGSGEDVDDDYCHVVVIDGRVVHIALLEPAAHLELLAVAASRYGLDAEALLSAAGAALAAPDRVVTVEVGERVPA